MQSQTQNRWLLPFVFVQFLLLLTLYSAVCFTLLPFTRSQILSANIGIISRSNSLNPDFEKVFSNLERTWKLQSGLMLAMIFTVLFGRHSCFIGKSNCLFLLVIIELIVQISWDFANSTSSPKINFKNCRTTSLFQASLI